MNEWNESIKSINQSTINDQLKSHIPSLTVCSYSASGLAWWQVNNVMLLCIRQTLLPQPAAKNYNNLWDVRHNCMSISLA